MTVMEAAVTACLSTRWGHLWKNVNHLRLDKHTFGRQVPANANKNENPDFWNQEATKFVTKVNEVLHHHNGNGIKRFNRCFIDLGYNGPAYTWTNKKFTSSPTYERLDRCLGNADWCKVFPSTTIYHLPMLYSDHAPILAVLNSSQPRTNKPFRFENWWLMEQDFQDVAKESWEHSSTRIFSYKTKSLAAELRKWRRKKPKNTELIAQIETQILDQQSLHPSLQNHNLQQHLHQQHQNLLAKEEAYHIQHVKKRWAVKGDRNTEFFHQAITKRNRKNTISHLRNPDGSLSTTPAQLSNTLINYFKSIFSSSTSNPLH
jgi:endonuclease/exonuclease/phosphatase family metal-dependent hydrolase